MLKLFGRLAAKKRHIYLDYASATPILPAATRAVTNAQQLFGNPVIDLDTMKMTNEVKTGRGPDGLAWAARK